MANLSYLELLNDFQNTSPRIGLTVPLEEKKCTSINWNTRTITLGSPYNPFLLVEGDHYAQRMWFVCDRYVDTVDLSNMACVIEYVNSAGEARIAPVLAFDTSKPEKLFFSWEVSGEAAKMLSLQSRGTLQFIVRFFAIDPVSKQFLFNIGTQPCNATILKGLNNPTDNDNNYGYPADDIKTIYSRLNDLDKMLDNQSINWWEFEDSSS